MPKEETPARRAAQWLINEHAQGRRFAPLSGPLRPTDIAAAYDVQDALVAQRQAAWQCGLAGYKIALTTPAMRNFVGYDNSIAGQVLSRDVVNAPARLRLSDFGHLGFECELAFRVGEDLPTGESPPDRARISRAIAAIAPAFELVDDRHADYTLFNRDDGTTMLSLAADNAWNCGVVLGAWREDWADIDLAAVHGVLRINDAVVGEGWGRDVLGHPLDAMVWIARHLHERGRGLKKGELVITGSLITSRFPQAGDRVVFSAAGVGEIELAVEQ